MAYHFEKMSYNGSDATPAQRDRRKKLLAEFMDDIRGRAKPGDTLITEWIANSLPVDFAGTFASSSHLVMSISSSMRHAVRRGEFTGEAGEYVKCKVVIPPAPKVAKHLRNDYLYNLVDGFLCRGEDDIKAMQAQVAPHIAECYRSPVALKSTLAEIRRRIINGDVGKGRRVRYQKQ